MKKKILLIGHRSFVGKKIKEFIVSSKKFIIYHPESYFNEKEILQLSTEKFNDIYFKKFKDIDYIVSCLHIHKNNLRDELNLNLKIYNNLFKFIKKNKIKKFIYLSSVNVSEDKNLSYSFVKCKIENLVKDLKSFVIVRPSTIISIEQNNILVGGKSGKSFSLFEKFFHYNFPIPVIGDGKYLFTYCFLDDLANFIILLLEEEFLSNKVINFFSGELIDFNTFIDSIGKVKGKKTYKIHLPLFLIDILCKFKIFNKKNIDNLLNQKIYYNFNNLIKEKIKINQLSSMMKK